MARYKAVLAYDGSRFRGFQRQAEGQTIQGTLEKVLTKIGWVEKSLLFAGRTDTGVHAYGQVIAFDLDWHHSLGALQKALNANLPNDISVLDVAVVSPQFHPRYDAVARHYRYHVFCLPERDPIREKFAWRVWPKISLNRLQEGAQYLLGTHNFLAFGSAPKKGGSTIRTITQATWLQETDGFTFDLIGNAFLYRMVRRTVCLLVDVAQGKFDPEIVNECLVNKTRSIQGIAPPQGLFLMAVYYPE